MDHSAIHILEWLSEMGDDVPLADEPIDRFAESEVLKQKALAKKSQQVASPTKASGSSLQDRVAAIRKASSAKPAAKTEPTIPDETVIQAAKKLAQSANSLTDLKEAISNFEGCNLRINAKNMVFANGNPQATIMLIDEHPGKQEDEESIPFAGRSAGMLERMLSAIGLESEHTYQVAALPWHPPGNRSPTLPEINICMPFLLRHIELAKPKIVIAMGNTPTRMLFGPTAQALTVRGDWQKLESVSGDMQFAATLNPSFLLKQPAQKRLAWQDLLILKAKLAELG